MTTEPLMAEVLAEMQRIGCHCPITTPHLTQLLNRERTTPLVIFEVRRALDRLHARGEVTCERDLIDRRVRYWEYAAPPSACTCDDDEGLEPPPPGDPTPAITGPRDAIDAAEALVEDLPRHMTDSLWTSVAVRPLAGLLLAASPRVNHRGVRWVRRTVGYSERATTASKLRTAAGVCRSAAPADGLAGCLADGLVRMASLSPRQRNCVSRTMLAALSGEDLR
ncbi:MAG: hypothetical protein K0U84_19000 [Actinomycetia bacterium]|nr:hypothetical protein [Actinomycetes bacterium]